MAVTGPSERSDDRFAAMEAALVALRGENARLRGLLGLDVRSARQPTTAWTPTLFSGDASAAPVAVKVDGSSSTVEKVALFASLFAGREDVYALRWENERTGKSGWGPAVRGGWSNSRRPDREYLPFSDEVIAKHLSGTIHAGLYPLLRGGSCRLLALTSTGRVRSSIRSPILTRPTRPGCQPSWNDPRSGDGAHVWMFFARRVPAASARRIGVHLLREAMTVRGELDLLSYDRLFPAQDFMPKGGSFGNLIALPLQGACSERGNTVFLDPTSLKPFGDQWAFLSTVEPLSLEAVADLANAFGDVAAGPDAATYRRPPDPNVAPKPPARIGATAGAMLGVDRIGVPPALLAALKHLASLHNPEFYEKEKMRFWTGNTPRFIRSYQETLDRLLLPRGLRDKATRIVAEAGSELIVTDIFSGNRRITTRLLSNLTPEQATAAEVLAERDHGVLVAPPGSGKTVIGCALIARHSVATLVIVDRKPLVEQWQDRLITHLDLKAKDVGQIGGGRNKPTGIVDVAMVQSLAQRDDLPELTAGYGLVIVDECHHVPAVTFERAVRDIPVRAWLGLTATPYRRDGLQALMSMHCGPVRHTMTAPEGAALRALELIVHDTEHETADDAEHIQTTFRGLVEDQQRTAAICDDIASAATSGRHCLVLTRWTEHLDLLTEQLATKGVVPFVLHGQMGKKARAAVIERLATPPPENTGLVLAATASLLGEGFDCPPLDTLFLAFPIKFKGSVVQYVGRVLRPTDTKTRIEVPRLRRLPRARPRPDARRTPPGLRHPRLRSPRSPPTPVPPATSSPYRPRHLT